MTNEQELARPEGFITSPQISQVTAADVQWVARRLIDLDRSVLAVVGP